jgi:hypothetical protein
MKLIPHPDCLVCRYWQDRISEEKQRTLAGNKSAYPKEQRARAELDAHLARTKHVEGDR